MSVHPPIATRTDGRWRRELPAWVVSVLLHAALLLLLAALAWPQRAGPESQVIIDLTELPLEDAASGAAAGAAATAAAAVPSLAPHSAHLPLVPELPHQAPTDGALDQPGASDAPDAMTATDAAFALLRDGDEPNAVPRRGVGGGAVAGGGEGGFGDELGRMRQLGLDVVFVLDATGNMGPFIAEAQQHAERIMNVLTGMIASPDAEPLEQRTARGQPLVRFGVVAFKDYGDEYGLNASIHQPLTHDRAAVRNFLDQIIVGGGGDQTESIHEALRVAVDPQRMQWRQPGVAVVVLVTEAPVHLTGREAAFETARQFARRGGVIHVIDVGAMGIDGRRRVNVLEDLARIARLGGGEAFLLHEQETFWQQMIVSIFGQRYASDVHAILRRYGEGAER